jgi:hypothetical protein
MTKQKIELSRTCSSVLFPSKSGKDIRPSSLPFTSVDDDGVANGTLVPVEDGGGTITCEGNNGNLCSGLCSWNFLCPMCVEVKAPQTPGRNVQSVQLKHHIGLDHHVSLARRSAHFKVCDLAFDAVFS